MRGTLGKYVSSIDVFGFTVELARDERSLQSLYSNFLPLIREVIAKIRDDRKGICLVLDDLNGICEVPEFAHFIKSVVDEIATDEQQPTPLLFILVGTPERMDDLRAHQPSISRIFEVVELSLMESDESREFFRKAFESVGVKLDEDASKILTRYSGGLPVLLHEVGDAVFWEDTDGVVDQRDALGGIIVAAENVGRKYLDRQVLHAIRSNIYRSILRKMARRETGPLVRKEILQQLTESEKKNFDNFVPKMKKLGVLRDGEERGAYDFTNELYRVYMMLEALREERRLKKS
jgi:hypothetical protein